MLHNVHCQGRCPLFIRALSKASQKIHESPCLDIQLHGQDSKL